MFILLPGGKMFKFNDILVPTDFSEQCRLAVNYAIELAKSTGAKLHVIHVVEPAVYPTDLGFPQVGLIDLDRELVNNSNSELKKLEDELKAMDLDVFTYVSHGKPSDEIVTYAFEHKVDLICIATHGRSGFEHFLFGSTTEKVLRKAPCPVLAVRSPSNRS
jgi:nucleotide-binding universal stress UspA family protein